MCEQFLGTWNLVSNEKFADYMKELGAGFATKKLESVAKPNVIINCNGEVITHKAESQSQEISFRLGGEFDKATADDRKVKQRDTQSVAKIGRRKAGCEMSGVICTRVYEKAGRQTPYPVELMGHKSRRAPQGSCLLSPKT
uniref:Lipocalin/cytosolic fatty-acid binding domain-containing protein n=1 Tax=Podarcis muralis TaxID=64176 RepID=A0A670JLY5_PODMU